MTNSKKSNTAVLLEIQSITREINKEFGGEDKVTHLGDFDVDSLVAYNRKLAPLKSYLETLSDKQLAQIQSIMYFGRDEDCTISEKHQQLKSVSNGRVDYIRTICEKIRNLEEYLENALRLAESMSEDIDNFE